MKPGKYIISFFILAIICTSCLNDDFLERTPKDKLTEETLFVENSNFETYVWSLYEVFPAYSGLGNLYGPGFEADDYFKGSKGSEDKWAWQKVKVPTTGGGWDYSFIRKVNIMLDNIDKENKLTPEQKEHWRSVGYFFRAYGHFDLVVKFGDVVWVDHVLAEDSPELYAPRDSREFVMDKIITDLEYAENNIIPEGDNTIDQDVVRALISRIGLFEGTWRKYHGLEGADKYLDECIRVSSLLIEKYPEIHSNYDEVFNSLDLAGVKGILLYRQYVKNVVTHSLSKTHMGSKLDFEMTKDAVDAFLCTDGRPIYMQADFPAREQDPYTEFADRDKRLLYNVLPPYRVATGSEAFEKEWWHTDNPKDRTFFPIMEAISSKGFKLLPITQSGGSVCKFSPHFTLHNGGFGFQATQGGYFPMKYLNHHEPYPVSGCTSDAPIFRIEEVMLNYAEALYEKNGDVDQDVIDKTINILRERGGVALLDKDNVIDDPRRDPDVAPLLWEIRRERRVELMGEGFRFNDIRRWKKGEYVNKEKMGRWYSADQLVADGVIADKKKCKIKFTEGDHGYITYYGDPVAKGLGWQDFYYLYPLPLDDLALNKQLEQNPGWDKQQ